MISSQELEEVKMYYFLNFFYSSSINKHFAELNQLLIQQDKSNKDTSYISEPWFDMYLRDRQPIVLNYNPFVAFVDDPRPAYNEQTIKATNFLISAIR